MEYTKAIFLLDENVRAIDVTYESAEKSPRTTYKSLDPKIKVGDMVVVPTNTRHGMTVCKVAAVDVEPDLESSTPMQWIVSVVDRSQFDDIHRQEEEAITRIKAAERKRRRDELREALVAGSGPEVRALCNLSAKKPGCPRDHFGVSD